MNAITIGHTRHGRPIECFIWERSEPFVLVIGGVHGDEAEGVILAKALLEKYKELYPFRCSLAMIPLLNIDGFQQSTRTNAAGVDLNRNMETRDWVADSVEEMYYPGPYAMSEPETEALVRALEEYTPIFIISIHSWTHPCINVNGPCAEEAQAASDITHYEICDTIGYPTPGCLGTYAGIERGIPTITYEIERGLDQGRIVVEHLSAIEAMIQTKERRALCTKR